MTAKQPRQPRQPKQAKPPKPARTSKSPSSPSRGSTAPDLLATLRTRFEAHPQRHPGLTWDAVAARLQAKPAALRALAEMERTGGEPDVVAQDAATGEVIFFDCSPETPAGRVSLCYDEEALAARKQHKPRGSATELASAIGIELLTEAQYLHLQQLGEFDTRTSSWLRTPAPMRALGGALFGDRRFGRVFLYHNGAESYYAVRGCRGALRV
ncbi:MAG: DUF4256 domain-containing protein [Planctomycetes bacterium]|nr:DUF4256 domain-containing protein [Planctomycetota bacterium]MCC7396548.1 DUF4256 domain-containing protein [Planctomycetota bacterium]